MALPRYWTHAVVHGETELAAFASEADAQRFADMFRKSVHVYAKVYIRLQSEGFTEQALITIQARTGKTLKTVDNG